MSVRFRLINTEKTVQKDKKTLPGAISRAVEYLLNIRKSDGCWSAELEGDTILESEYIILMRFLGRGDEAALKKAAAHLLKWQLPNGGWPIFPGGPVDVGASVKSYWALKMTGTDPDEPYMIKAREAIRAAGGVPVVNSYTKFYLAMLGQIEWNDAPAVPPELMLLPNWFYLNIYEISSWSRAFVIPLSIIWAHKKVTRLPEEQGIGELFDEGEREKVRLHIKWPLFTWRNFFIGVDAMVKLTESLKLLFWRGRAVKRAEHWMLEHCEHSAGLGAIFPPMVYALIAMRVLGYPDDNPHVQRAWNELRALEIEDDHSLRLQPCTSPVWDTAIAINALIEAGIEPDHSVITEAVEWLISKEVRYRGDWRIKRPNLEPGGWYFEFRNDFYPDIDDTAMVLMALEKAADTPGKREAMQRGIDWLLGMQGSDGGWASFDVDNNKSIFNFIPFADHNAMLDPSTSDITARILEMLSFVEDGKNHPRIPDAIDFLRKEQEEDGAWYGRWGVNYVYGTWQAIRGLTRIGVNIDDPMIKRGAEWLRNTQNDDGGWGESCISYYNPEMRAKGLSTASQTAWAIMGLICAGEAESDCVKRGINYLIETQNEDGTWNEDYFTGTGFPRVFYLRYHLYRHSFPTMALGMYAQTLPEEQLAQSI